MSVASDQVPAAGGISLDHVAHWVPAIDAASARMEQLGFALTPYSSQRLPPKPGRADDISWPRPAPPPEAAFLDATEPVETGATLASEDKADPAQRRKQRN